MARLYIIRVNMGVMVMIRVIIVMVVKVLVVMVMNNVNGLVVTVDLIMVYCIAKKRGGWYEML
jgi:hypothetical protein